MNIKLFPLTGPQKNILKLDQINVSNTNLNTIYAVLKLPKDTDLHLLDLTLNKIREVNDSLRLRFYFPKNSKITDKSQEIYQYIEDYKYIPTRVIYHNSSSILDVIENEKKDVLSLDGKLVELAIIKTPFNTFVLYKTHHILSDGWGMTQVADQIKEIYCMFEKGEDLHNYKKPSYINFINKEQEYLNSQRYERDIEFWKETVKNIQPCTIFKNSDNFNKSAKRFIYEIPKDICTEIDQYCSTNKITEYSFFLAIISVYFYHIYNLNDFAIGTPFLNRQKRLGEFEETGLHISTLPLHISIGNNESFLDLCNNISSKNIGLYKHGNLPYCIIQKLYNTENHINNNLYEIGFSYQINISEREFTSKTYNKQDTSIENTGIGECEWIFSGEQNNSITFHITQLNRRKLFSIDYLTSIFTDTDINKINDIIFFLVNSVLHYCPSNSNTSNITHKFDTLTNSEALNDVTNQIENNTYNDCLIDDLNVLTSKEISLLQDFNNTGNTAKITKTVIDCFEEIVNKFPNNTALIYNNKRLTYLEFNEKVNLLSNFLLKNNIKKGSPILLVFDKSFDMLISIFATLKIGCYYVPILPDENESRVSYIINDCKPSCVLAHKNYDTMLKKFNLPCYNLTNLDDAINANVNTLDNSINTNINILDNSVNTKMSFAPNIQAAISPSDIAYTIYTSGSTGNPKGVQVMHKNIVGFMHSMEENKYLKPSPVDVSMSLLKYSFDASGIDIYSSLLTGGSLVLVSKNDELNPIKVLELIEQYHVTRSFLIPKWIEYIVSTSLHYNFNIDSLKILGTGGEILQPKILTEFLEKHDNLKIVNLYGPTETTMFSSYKIITKSEIEKNYTSIGKPIPFCRIGIVNSNNKFLPLGYEGEIVIFEDEKSIENIAKGYLNLPDLSNRKFVNIFNPITNTLVHAYKTGDIAKINNNLELEFIGRTDDIVKVNGGYLVALNEVENRISNLLGNNIEVHCVAVPYKNTKAIVLFLKNDEKSISINNIKKYLQSHLSFYMQPKKIIELPEIPRKATGKVDTQLLKNVAFSELNLQNNNIIKPRTGIEIYLYNTIKNVTNIDEFSITDDFFDDLGIDSLALTSIYVNTCNYNLTIQDFYTYPNIQDLAKYIKSKSSDTHITTNLYLKPEIENIENMHFLNNCKSFDLSTVLITGVTGFLGIHLLRELLLHAKVKTIYCIIRNKISADGNLRLKNMINFYFNSDKELLKLINEKVVVLNGDITKPNFNLHDDTYMLLKKSVKTVINSAANVKHFAKPEKLQIDNVVSVDTIIKFCENNISLAHISTLSIAGFKGESTLNTVFDENSLYINQEFNNKPYLISKFNAEKHILDAIINNGLNAKIFRLGNIMPRFSDGKFQQNRNQNIFVNSVTCLLNLQTISKELLDLNVEFSPVDECACAIIDLLNYGHYNVYHILNNNEISINNLIEIFNNNGYSFKLVDSQDFMDKLDLIDNEYVKEYILDTNLNAFSQYRSLSDLESCGFHWSTIDKDYIINTFNIKERTDEE